MGEEARDDDSVTTRQAAEIAKGVAAKSVGAGKDAKEIREDYNIYFRAYKKERATNKTGHSDTIDKIFKMTPAEINEYYFPKKK